MFLVCLLLVAIMKVWRETVLDSIIGTAELKPLPPESLYRSWHTLTFLCWHAVKHQTDNEAVTTVTKCSLLELMAIMPLRKLLLCTLSCKHPKLYFFQTYLILIGWLVVNCVDVPLNNQPTNRNKMRNWRLLLYRMGDDIILYRLVPPSAHTYSN